MLFVTGVKLCVQQKYQEKEYDGEVRLLIHQSQAGCIIGRAGFKIKELREVSMLISWLSSVVDGHTRVKQEMFTSQVKAETDLQGCESRQFNVCVCCDGLTG